MLVRALVVVAALASSARADDGKLFGVKATLGVYDGIGGGIRVGDARLGVQVIGGWQPLFVASQTDSSQPPDIDVYSTLQANADVYVLFSEPTPRSSIGMTVGYKGSTHLGHGAGIGFYVAIDAHERVSYFLIGGVTWFPNGEDQLRDKKSIAMDREFSFPGPALNAGVNLGVDFAP
jgi:hypothetical protein